MEKQWVKKSWKKSLNIRMLLSYMSVIVLLAIMLAGVISTIYAMQWKKEMNSVVLQKLDLIDIYVNKQIDQIRNMHETFLSNQELQDIVTKAHYGEISFEEKQAVYKRMQQYREKNANIMSCLIVDTNGEILDTRGENKIYDSLLSKNDDFDEMITSKKMSLISAPSTFPLQMRDPEYQEKNTITYYGKYYEKANYDTTGYILINWKKSDVFGEANKVADSTFMTSCVLDRSNRVIYQQNPVAEAMLDHITGRKYENTGSYSIKINGQGHLLFIKTIKEYPEWRFIGLISLEQMNKPLTNVYVVLVVITVGMLFVVAVISSRIAQGITKPIYLIIEAMKKLGQGSYPEPIAVSSEDEMKKLVTGFNSMVLDIHNLQDNIKAERNKQSELEIAMMKSKLDLLQGQINPHFIHNTLNTMKYMAQKEGNKQLVHTIVAFNTLIRTSMNTGNDFITVSEEIENLNHYLEIQKQRYDTEIKIECYVFDDMDLVLLPKLILQPLVENSLFHGIIPKGSGMIKIVFRRDKKHLFISVSDNGVGIPADKQKNILQEHKNSKLGYNNIGLVNVNQRLVIYYGESSHLEILSSTAFGTFISFRIPI